MSGSYYRVKSEGPQRRYGSAAPASRHSTHTNYGNIIRNYVLNQHVNTCLDYIPNLNEKDKKGLRVLEAVFNSKGEKKFRKRE